MRWQESDGYRAGNAGFSRWWRWVLFREYPKEIQGIFVTARDVEWVLADMLDKLKPEFRTFADKATAAWLDSDLPGMLERAIRNFVRQLLPGKNGRRV